MKAGGGAGWARRGDSPDRRSQRLAQRCVLLISARLAWEMKCVAKQTGVRVAKQTPVSKVQRSHVRYRIETPRGTVSAQKIAFGMNALSVSFPQLHAKQVPIYTGTSYPPREAPSM